jgi:hypothetical protein
VPDPITTAAATGAGRAAIEWMKAEVARVIPRFVSRPKTAWKTLWTKPEDLELQRLEEQGKDWPAKRCLRVRALPSKAHYFEGAEGVVVAGETASVAFSLWLINVAPFRVTLRAYSIMWDLDLPGERGACRVERRDSLPGYTELLPGGEHALAMRDERMSRLAPQAAVREGTSLLKVNGEAVLLGPWAAHEQRVPFESWLWLPTRVGQ